MSKETHVVLIYSLDFKVFFKCRGHKYMEFAGWVKWHENNKKKVIVVFIVIVK